VAVVSHNLDLSKSVGTLSVRVTGFSAIIGSPDAEEVLGKVAGDDKLPKATRRRMSDFDLGVARCIIGLVEGGVDEEIVFASRHGNMGITTDLLMQLASPEVLSPAKFSMAVHNAPVGVVSLITVNRAGHTAVAGGARSMAAALTEGWLRLETGSPSVLVCYTDAPLVGVYDGFDEPGPCVHLAMRVSSGSGAGPGENIVLEDGRVGAVALARALAGGTGGITWRP
jgi:hypothetical protein